MDLIDKTKEEDLLTTMIKEAAKAKNEIACANRDVEKAQNRLGFVLLLLNRLMERKHATERPSQRTPTN